jgi:alpha-L-rhamnosidase
MLDGNSIRKLSSASKIFSLLPASITVLSEESKVQSLPYNVTNFISGNFRAGESAVKRLNLLIAVIVAIMPVSAASAKPVHLRVEYLENPLGIDAAAPHLSWQSDAVGRNWKQSAYEVAVGSREESLQSGDGDIWDSGRVESSDSVGIVYRGPALESRKRYYWKVRVWDGAGQVSESTETAWWEMGLLQATDWKAKWIHWTNPEDESDRREIRWIWAPGQDALALVPKTVARFRISFHLSEKARGAVLLLASRGDFVTKVNGHEVDAKSRWTTFDRRDILDQLVVGKNEIDVTVTAPEPSEFGPNEGAKTATAALAALVKITRANGSILRFPTNEHWKATLAKSRWQAARVVAELGDKRLGDPGQLPQPAAYLRKTLALSKTVQSARLYVTALGSYRVFLNGSQVGNDVMTPDFTDYRKRVLYQAYNVTRQMVRGDNVIGALLGDGWYGSGLTWNGVHFFSPPDRFLAQLELNYADGSHDTFVTDESWKATASPIVRSDIYGGEVYDARLEQAGWLKTEYDDSKWRAAVAGNPPGITVSSQITPPARVIATLNPKAMTPVANGVYIFDMGQNMVGWVTLKVKGDAGTKVRLRFAEILNPDGTIYTANLRNADATDVYVLRGGDEETFSPHFTFHGFRYVEVTGYPGTPPPDAIMGDVVSSVSGDTVAKLTTSSDLVNRMWSIGIWGQRGNFLSVPTDCPQRDERLGWMGDAGVFWRTGSYNFDIAAFSQKFIQDIVDAQSRQGAFRNVSPNTLPSSVDEPEEVLPESDMVGAPGWGDAGVIVPWTTWLQYGDKAVIEENWNPMQRWMEFIQSRNPDFLRTRGVGPNFADWLAPDENTNKDLLATAYWALIANMMSQMAHAVGKEADAKRYDELVQNIRGAFQKAYIKEDGTVGTGTQTSYVVALYTRMAPAALEPLLVNNLVKDIEARNWHLSTGFLGTPFLLFTLADHGRSDVAYRLLLNDTYPSWGYMLSKGATTWWERWNGDTGDPSMNSYNHYAFGSVIAWVYRYAAGIDTTPDSPGFKEIVIHPHLDARMASARAEYESVYGKIISDWNGTPAGPFSLRVTIPPNTTAKVLLPAFVGAHVTEDGNPVDAQPVDGSYALTVGSGSYSFEVK